MPICFHAAWFASPVIGTYGHLFSICQYNVVAEPCKWLSAIITVLHGVTALEWDFFLYRLAHLVESVVRFHLSMIHLPEFSQHINQR